MVSTLKILTGRFIAERRDAALIVYGAVIVGLIAFSIYASIEILSFREKSAQGKAAWDAMSVRWEYQHRAESLMVLAVCKIIPVEDANEIRRLYEIKTNPDVVFQSWYTVPTTPQIVQASFFQTDVKTLPDLPAVVYAPAFVALVAALGVLWLDNLALRKRANQKEDERDKNDVDSTRVFSGLESILRNLPDAIDRRLREGFDNLRNREH